MKSKEENKGWEMQCDICGKYKFCLRHQNPDIDEWSCVECYNGKYDMDGMQK